MISSSRQQIRQQMRDMRNTLSSSFIDQASLHLKAHIAQLTELKSVKKVALYLANDGELNPMPSIEWLWQQGIDVYIPVLHPFSKGSYCFSISQQVQNLLSTSMGSQSPDSMYKISAP
ncbi:5-formyltetrahydrofolate cyclo-ligase [Vibrio sp. JCM 19236]|nr:5-formyltetrahydrofolate cyclo-ligase [Vibrio sp. JCM 19236]